MFIKIDFKEYLDGYIHMSGHSTQEGEGSIRPPSWYHVHGVQASLVRALGDPGEEHSFPTVIPEAH